VDVIIDLGKKAIPLEIKSGETITSDYFDGLNYWRKLAGQKQEPGPLSTRERIRICATTRLFIHGGTGDGKGRTEPDLNH